MTNYHTHSSYCDGSASPREMVEFALSHGFTSLGFSGHGPLPFENTFSIKDYDGYCCEIRSLATEYAGRIDIRLGLEVDYVPGMQEDFTPLIEQGSLEYTIGSVHLIPVPGTIPVCAEDLWFIDGPRWERYDEGLFRLFDGDIRRGVRAYFDQQNEMLVRNKPTVVGHPDKIVMHNRGRYFSEDEPWYRSLALVGVPQSSSSIFAWIPTITMLSRQAIFRGDDPVLSYKQTPASEEKLWSAWWTAKGVPSSDVQYIYGESDIEVWSTTRRLALVTVTLDEVMHISERPDLLLACTQAWAWNFAKQILTLHDAGLTVYITTDHGNVLAEGRGILSSAEKTHLFADGSRGARHLIYDASEPMKEFLSSRDASVFLVRDNWLAYRDTQAFLRPGKHQITHGGSHLLEVAIPFIEIPL